MLQHRGRPTLVEPLLVQFLGISFWPAFVCTRYISYKNEVGDRPHRRNTTHLVALSAMPVCQAAPSLQIRIFRQTKAMTTRTPASSPASSAHSPAFLPTCQ